jgi:hypothetical protein
LWDALYADNFVLPTKAHQEAPQETTRVIAEDAGSIFDYTSEDDNDGLPIVTPPKSLEPSDVSKDSEDVGVSPWRMVLWTCTSVAFYVVV